MLPMGDESEFWDLVWPDVEYLAVDAVEIVEEVLWINSQSEALRDLPGLGVRCIARAQHVPASAG
ncbi:hypothetical protein ACU686_12255 [Yinghuangia aomiensis]